jgi:hypothetical protein
LGFPGCPPMSKLRGDFALERTSAHRFRFSTSAIKGTAEGGGQSDTDGDRGANLESEWHRRTSHSDRHDSVRQGDDRPAVDLELLLKGGLR